MFIDDTRPTLSANYKLILVSNNLSDEDTPILKDDLELDSFS